MVKKKLIYSASQHLKGKSHEVRVFKNEQGIKMKMTYEAYNAVERFTGEQFVNGKWEHTFSMLDLGVSPESSIYVSDEGKRETRADNLFKSGIKLFNILNQ